MPATGALYHDSPAPAPRRKATLDAFMESHGHVFPQRWYARYFLDTIFLPASRDWAFLVTGKVASSAALHVLFELEFGAPLTTAFVDPYDINPDAAVHRLHHARVLRTAQEHKDGFGAVTSSLRLSMVRHPSTRALSGFLYLCETHDRQHPWLLAERMRMTALVQFDWERDCRTPAGFEKFLDYLQTELEHEDAFPVNNHFRPQHLILRSQIYDPHIVGRSERLDDFCHQVAAALDRPLPKEWRSPVSNRQRPYDPGEFLGHGSAPRLLASIFEQDFETFGYDPNGWADESQHVRRKARSDEGRAGWATN